MNSHKTVVRKWAGFVCAAAIVLAMPALAQTSAQVTLTGELKGTLVLAPADLPAFPAEQQASFTQTRGASGQESRTTVRGVRLAAAIERAGLKTGGHDDAKTLLVIATATDGYRAVFSWLELSNTATGKGVLLVYERDGQPLGAREGSIALLSSSDNSLSARHVRNVAKVEVRQVGP
jgi:hypothetical protein